MNSLIDNTANYNDFSELTRLRADAQQNNPGVLRQVAEQFEAIFIQMMMKSMRDASVPFESGVFNSSSTKAYTDMYDKQMGVELASQQGIGLADVIVRQLSQQTATPPTQSDITQSLSLALLQRNIPLNNTDDGMPDVIIGAASETPEFEINDNFQGPHWSNPEDFIRDCWPHAVRAGSELNVDPRVIVAQSALETGWGQHVPHTQDGQNSYSLFGIKADHRWDGDSVNINTLEFRNGVMNQERAAFRAYDSVAEAFDDYVQFLQSSPRYEAVINSDTASEYSRGLQDAGYATDPDYADKIERIRSGGLLNNTVSALQDSNELPLT